MREKHARFGDLLRFFFVIGLSLILLISLNFTINYFLSALTLIIMFFLPGYSIVNILFNKKGDIPEIFVLSVATSISIFILIAMGVHFIGIRISVSNILYPVIILSLILGILDFLKNLLFTKKVHRVKI